MGFRSRLKEKAAKVRSGRRKPVDERKIAEAARIKPRNAETQVLADHLDTVHNSVRDQLDVLRKTRGQRKVGALKVPAHLREAMRLGNDGVEVRANIADIAGEE